MFERPAEHAVKEFSDVLNSEAEELWKRRQVVEDVDGGVPRPTGIPTDLVGLALSGGGIRSASVGLGVLQAFHKLGLLKFVDYLSTVSGGGYIGCAYSSAVATAREKPCEDRFPLDRTTQKAGDRKQPSEPQIGQSASVLRLIYGGNYLFRPWEATNKYLIGLCLNNVLLFSGLAAACSLLVLFWRMLDRQAVRDVLGLIWLDRDVYVAFFPFLGFSACWLFAWFLSYWKYAAEAPGRWAQRWLYLALAALLVGCVMLLVNGYSTVGFFQAFLGGDRKTSSDDLGKWLLSLLGAGLVPLFKPDLIERGLKPRGLLDKLLFYTAGTALLVGIPLAVVGLLGQQNLSDTATAPGHVIRSGDIYSWPAFCGLVARQRGDDLDVADDASMTPMEPLSDADLSRLKNYRQAAARGPLAKSNQEGLIVLAAKQLDYLGQKLAIDLRKRDRLAAALEAEYPHFWDRLFLLGGWFLMDGNPAAELWRAKREIADEGREFCALFSETILTHPRLASYLASETGPLTALAQPLGVASEPRFPNIAELGKRLEARKLAFTRDLSETLSDARLSSRADWYANDRASLNRAILLAMHPECFWEPDTIYRWNVVDGDQHVRRWIFGISATVFALALLVNVNATSLHRFYRNRLAYAYLSSEHGGRRRLNLSALHTTEYGAPYHLINASINLNRPRFLDEVDRECEKEGAELRDAECFLFSKLFCGCGATGWAGTASFEAFLDDNISVADAMAISGAAVDTLELNSFPLALLGLALNLNLGQWLPNPKYRKPLFKPRAWRLLADCRRSVADAGYCSVADGGFSDNLGFLSLLKRRCRLIVLVDAGCDEKHEFTDLARSVRHARIHEGIQLRDFGRRRRRDLDTRPLRLDGQGFCQRHYLVGRIIYPPTPNLAGPKSGLLIYIKPCLTGEEGVDLLEQRCRDRSFPHHATDDQFYSAQDVECYRQLGFEIASDAGRLFNGLYQPGKSLWSLRRPDLDKLERIIRRRRRRQADMLGERVSASETASKTAMASATKDELTSRPSTMIAGAVAEPESPPKNAPSKPPGNEKKRPRAK